MPVGTRPYRRSGRTAANNRYVVILNAPGISWKKERDMQHSISQDNTSSDEKLTRVLLLCGVVAGPLYIIVGGIEMLTRPGFDPTRPDLSLMSNGDWGWIHISLFVLTGLLTIAGAVGMRRVLTGSRGGTWGPILVGIYGLGLIGAGFFVADPAWGFPPGT